MSVSSWLEILAVVVLLAISTPILGNYMAKVYGNQAAPGDRFFLPVERFVYRICGVDPESEQRWTTYVLSMLVYTAAGILLLYAVLRLQGHLPFNADSKAGLPTNLSFNTAISFGTNTDWQNYLGEATMSHFSQMFGLMVKQFVSAAVGMALAAAFIRALVRRRQTTLGNFWVDTVRSITRILLPIAFVFGIFFISQGAIQNFNSTKTVHTVAVQSIDANGHPVKTQSLPGGPAGSFTPIEGLGDNGGGFFNANGAHTYQLPNPISSTLYIWLLLMIPFAFPWTFGKMIGSLRQGFVVLTAMAVLFSIGLVIAAVYEGNGNPKLPSSVSQAATSSQVGGNLEGKDTRLGVGLSTLDANGITSTSTGTTNSAHESYTPIGGAVPLFQIMLGEVDPGGTGTGLYGMLILVFISTFIAGLMVGRTPEYLGKKIQAREVKLTALYLLVLPFSVLVISGIAIGIPPGLQSLWSSGTHGLTELVYAYTSMAHNNGSAFGGLSGNTTWYTVTGGIVMLVGRFALIIPALAIAGSLVRKRALPDTAGTLRTDTPLFTGLLMVVTIIVTGLTYFPVLALGPLAEHFTGHF
jgi:K+-transporting ATPase ATPase A chain